MTNKIVLFIVSWFLFTSTQVVYSAFPDENFTSLEKIKIGDQISADILSLGEKTTGTEKDIYTFESERYSHSHVVYLTDNKVSFIQLTIPKNSQEKYQKEFRVLGPPEERLPKTKSEIIYGYPSKGLAFIVNGYSGNVERVQKFASKSVEEFRGQEGKNFTPVEISKLLPVPSVQPVSSTPTLTSKFYRWLEKVPSWGLLTIFLFSTAGSAGLLLWLFWTLRAKNGQS